MNEKGNYNIFLSDIKLIDFRNYNIDMKNSASKKQNGDS